MDNEQKNKWSDTPHTDGALPEVGTKYFVIDLAFPEKPYIFEATCTKCFDDYERWRRRNFFSSRESAEWALAEWLVMAKK